MKQFILVMIFGIIAFSNAFGQNYWLEFQVNDSTKYYPIAEIKKLTFSEIDNANAQLILHSINGEQIDFPVAEIEEVTFSEDTSAKIFIKLIDKPIEEIVFSAINRIEFKNITGIGEEISFVHVIENYPNPFESHTNIEFELLTDSHLKIVVNDLFGNEVKLIDNSFYTKGEHIITWDGLSSAGINVSPGVYYCTIRSGKGAIINKMLKVR